ncbi:MAG: prepilin-type N-terminal cleavage/methylation domain-containing protein [Trueperaceae bacterium]
MSSRIRKRQLGITLVELLIALAIFGLVMAMAYGGIVNALRVQGDQEIITTAQARLRRVVEVITQDIRSAVFGSITGVPYASDSDSISFMLLSGAAGFAVDINGYSTTSTNTTITASPSDIAALTSSIADGGLQMVMVNGTNGQGVVYNVTRINSLGNSRYELQHPSCRNTIDQAGGIQLFEIARLGLRYDADDRTIYMREDTGAEQPLAFEIDGLSFRYTYRAGTASIVRDEPFLRDGVPSRRYVDGASSYSLDRIQMVITSREISRGREIERTYSGTVDLSSNESYRVMEVVACGT